MITIYLITRYVREDVDAEYEEKDVLTLTEDYAVGASGEDIETAFTAVKCQRCGA